MTRRDAPKIERANAAVELALLLPVLVVIVCGALDFSRAFYAYVTVASTAHEAARYAARSPGGLVTPSALQTRVAAESQGFVRLGVASGGNASLVGPSLEGIDEQVVKVTLTYQFSPIVPVPVPGPINIRASASAPTGGAGGVATSTPVATPTITPSPTVTRTPTITPSPTITRTPTTVPSATASATPCAVPSFMGDSLNGSTALNKWTAAGFSAGNFTKHENNGTVQRQDVVAGTCATAAITLHNHP
ncbi:MAG TPA: TadE/TadG family type IV pilus assembly protein [Chloroflexota bacterium]|nr:TadE/TadG family type IV pilus assembly protein [Chloroflexota bacterium]